MLFGRKNDNHPFLRDPPPPLPPYLPPPLLTHTFQLTPYFQAIFNDPLFCPNFKNKKPPLILGGKKLRYQLFRFRLSKLCARLRQLAFLFSSPESIDFVGCYATRLKDDI